MRRDEMMLDYQKVRSFLNDFALSVGLDAEYLSPDGSVRICSEQCDGSELCNCLCGMDEGTRRCTQSHLDAGISAHELGEHYISRCHAGLVIIAAPLVRAQRYIGALICRPARMWTWDEVAVEEVRLKTADLPVPGDVIEKSCLRIPEMTGRRARAVAEMLLAFSKALTMPENHALLYRREVQRQQMDMANIIMQKKRDMTMETLDTLAKANYPLNLERELLSRVRLGDRSGAVGILNNMMADIFLKTAGNLEVMKARILELVVMISRAAVEGGAALEKLLGLNFNFISELSGLEVYEDVCLWVVRVLNTFMDTVYETRNTKTTRFLNAVLEHIRANYMENLTLDSVARSVHISPYYLSHLFKDELGVTFVEYLTRVRVEAAKRMLRQTPLSVQQIGQAVGYEDPSYFGKVFRKSTGETPNRFRRYGY